MAVPLKYLGNFWKTLEMHLINCKINLIITWPLTCVITNSIGAETFAITDRKRYIPVATLSIQNNLKPLDQLKSGFKRTINCNRYQSKVSIEKQNQ